MAIEDEVIILILLFVLFSSEFAVNFLHYGTNSNDYLQDCVYTYMCTHSCQMMVPETSTATM